MQESLSFLNQKFKSLLLIEPLSNVLFEAVKSLPNLEEKYLSRLKNWISWTENGVPSEEGDSLDIFKHLVSIHVKNPTQAQITDRYIFNDIFLAIENNFGGDDNQVFQCFHLYLLYRFQKSKNFEEVLYLLDWIQGHFRFSDNGWVKKGWQEIEVNLICKLLLNELPGNSKKICYQRVVELLSKCTYGYTTALSQEALKEAILALRISVPTSHFFQTQAPIDEDVLDIYPSSLIWEPTVIKQMFLSICKQEHLLFPKGEKYLSDLDDPVKYEKLMKRLINLIQILPEDSSFNDEEYISIENLIPKGAHFFILQEGIIPINKAFETSRKEYVHQLFRDNKNHLFPEGKNILDSLFNSEETSHLLSKRM